MKEIANALELKNELDNLRPIDKEKEAIIMQKFRLDWNYHSNHLEGNSLTYGETKALLLFGITAQGKPLKDTLEITGHNEAINWVIDLVKGERPLTENFIRELHSLLLKDSYKESKNAEGVIVPRKISAGKCKTTPNHVETVTGEIFRFATPEETPAKMHDLLNWYAEKSKEDNVNPILVAAEFHYRFIRIHPFDDGNGRTARILMNFILMQFGFPPVIIKTEDKANYFAALRMADAGNIEVFVNYIAQNLVQSLEIMIAGAKGESIEEDDDLDKEIALLEQRINKTNYKKHIKKQDIIRDLFDIIIIKLILRFHSRMSKFSKLYSETDFEISLDNNKFDTVEKFKEFYKEYKFNNLDNILILKFLFAKLKTEEEKCNLACKIIIRFKESYYSIQNGNQDELKFSYSDNLNEFDINKIVDITVKRHKEFIEKKIAEKENK